MELQISENIKRMRKSRAMTQEQLAEALGVTVGAVYKWENGLSTPEIRMLVEIADFFDTSVDVLLGYRLREGGMDAAIDRICALRRERKLTESAREAEKALQKYPNRFEVLYHSVQTYFLMASSDENAAKRCIALLERAIALFDHNPYENVTLYELQEAVATCHIGLKQYDRAIELLETLNTNGSQNAMIGLILAQFCNRPQEALRYLSDGFGITLTAILRIVSGYANAYEQLGDYKKAFAIIRWFYDACKGIRDTSVITFMDKMDALFLAYMADLSLAMGDEAAARAMLKDALAAAARFDAAPEYRSFVGMTFYHGSPAAVSIDDFGDTAMLAIEHHLREESCSAKTYDIWKELCHEIQ